MKFRNLGRWILGSLVLITAVAATTYAGQAPVPAPEADPTTLTVVGLLAVGYLARVAKFRRK